MQSDNTMLTAEEQAILDKTNKIRLDILDNMVKDGVPDKVGDIRVLNEIAQSLDNSVHANVKNRNTANNNETDKAAMAAMVAAVLSNTNQDMYTPEGVTIPTDRVTSLPATMSKEYVPGEMEIAPDELDPKDFIKEENDN